MSSGSLTKKPTFLSCVGVLDPNLETQKLLSRSADPLTINLPAASDVFPLTAFNRAQQSDRLFSALMAA